MRMPLALPGVLAGQKPPATDAEILVSPGHVLGARLRDYIGPYHALAKIGLVVVAIGAVCHYFQPPMLDLGGAVSGVQPNWPSPLHQVYAAFSPNSFPAIPRITARSIHKINAAFRAGGLDLENLPAGLTADQASKFLNSDLPNWIAKSGQDTDMASTAGQAGLSNTLTVTRTDKFLAHMTAANLAGGLIGIPTGALSGTTDAVRALPDSGGGVGPFFYGAIIDHQFGLYVLTAVNGGISCVTIAGPAIGPCAEATQDYVDGGFGSQGGFQSSGVPYLTAVAGLAKSK